MTKQSLDIMVASPFRSPTSRTDKFPVFVSLDLETSGTDHDLHVPIQIGLTLENDLRRNFSSLIGGWDWSEKEWSEDAARVHGISKEKLDLGSWAPSADLVDQNAAYWLESNLPSYAKGKRNLVIPLGWNVAAFDMPFVRRYLPRLAGMLSYRTVDLNAIAFFLGRERFPWVKRESKRRGRAEVARVLSIKETFVEKKAHDAGIDALVAAAAFQYMRRAVDDPRDPLGIYSDDNC